MHGQRDGDWGTLGPIAGEAPVDDLDVGASLETVLLSGLFDNHLRIWRGDGAAEDRVVSDASVAETIGHGVLARTSPEPNRFREVALLDVGGSSLVLLGRSELQPGLGTVEADAHVVRATLAGAPQPLDVAAWAAWGRWLSDVSSAAATRGEYVVVETGGWESGKKPYVLMGVFHEADGWTSLVEADPAPAFEPWTQAARDGGSSVVAPAAADTVGVAGLLAVQSIAMWAQTPLDVVLTFGTNPAGAWAA